MADIRLAGSDNIATSIRLSGGHFALIDLADLPLVSQYKWCANVKDGGVYAMRNAGPGEFRYLHQFLLGRIWVDHENSLGLDCRRSNLRPCNSSQNAQNRAKSSASQQPYKGIARRGDCWRAYIYIEGKRKWLGTYALAEDAARARDAVARELHGKFARLNFPDYLPEVAA